jgi:endogenous inhibitor of DNA gyrase (YacG/DUF329 family)
MVRRCPLCRRETEWENNPWRPFCSERCQLIDLGKWADEEYRVPLTETPDGLPSDFDREGDSEDSEEKFR